MKYIYQNSGFLLDVLVMVYTLDSHLVLNSFLLISMANLALSFEMFILHSTFLLYYFLL